MVIGNPLHFAVDVIGKTGLGSKGDVIVAGADKIIIVDTKD